jgi:RNA processing factor Prp31
MGNQIIRQETTDIATNKIIQMLNDKKDYTSALLLASIYVDMRIRTIIALQLDLSGQRFEEISNILDSQVGFRNLIGIIENMGKIKKQEADKLRELYTERCKVAHETTLWKDVSEAKQEEIKKLCNVAIDFLKKTTNL